MEELNTYIPTDLVNIVKDYDLLTDILKKIDNNDFTFEIDYPVLPEQRGVLYPCTWSDILKDVPYRSADCIAYIYKNKNMSVEILFGGYNGGGRGGDELTVWVDFYSGLVAVWSRDEPVISISDFNDTGDTTANIQLATDVINYIIVNYLKGKPA